MDCKSLWIKVSAKCINVNVVCLPIYLCKGGQRAGAVQVNLTPLISRDALATDASHSRDLYIYASQVIKSTLFPKCFIQ